MAAQPATETLSFQAEVKQLLRLMVHSLYSNKEIFLRELVSNASDAADKLRFEALSEPALLADDPELRIRVEPDAGAGTLAVADNGIGMSREEVVANLGTIARSGTAEFLARLTGDEQEDARLIGQFGVGFYSSFIVADRVEVYTRRAGAEPGEGVHWSSDGEGEFTLEACTLESRGTRVVLHLKADEREFLEPGRLRELITRYSDHIGFPVYLDTGEDDEQKEGDGEADAAERPVNSATALWTRPRSEIADDEYIEFYKHLTHDFEAPLAWSHNRVEGRREYTSLLYIPARAPFDLWNREAARGLKLYVQRVFIMDRAEQFLPLYLRFVRGVVDASDLPLNVSRELLQSHPALDSLRSALTRRALDMLAKLAEDEPGKYAAFWREFGTVMKEGMGEDAANADRIARLLRFTSTRSDGDNADRSLADYLADMDDEQEAIYYVTADSLAAARSSPQLEVFRERGVEVLLLCDRIDEWMLAQFAEFEGKPLKSVAREGVELPAGGGMTQESLDDEHKALLKKIKQVLRDRVEAVHVSRRLVDSPACLIVGEHDLSPQLRELLAATGQKLPDSRPVFEVNPSHPLVARLAEETDEARLADLIWILFDQARLAEGGQLGEPAAYVARINRFLTELVAAPSTAAGTTAEAAGAETSSAGEGAATEASSGAAARSGD